MFSALISLHRIRRQSTNEQIKLESLALEVALIAFMGAAVFINRMYAEILYWLVAMAASLTNIHDASATQTDGATETNPATVRAA
jgi:hypothetical protein